MLSTRFIPQLFSLSYFSSRLSRITFVLLETLVDRIGSYLKILKSHCVIWLNISFHCNGDIETGVTPSRHWHQPHQLLTLPSPSLIGAGKSQQHMKYSDNVFFVAQLYSFTFFLGITALLRAPSL
uniref:Uncharacterized protein n=1 Tax=Cacopsylla melanoneura TaxID=428564 RepID=A0A8D8WCV2_9HEMI